MNSNAEEVQEIVRGFGPVLCRLGKTSVFENVDHDVLKVDVESDGLDRLNKLLRESLPHESSPFQFSPHITLAYLRPGAGAKYAGDDRVKGKELTFDAIVFSDADGNETFIALDGETSLRRYAFNPNEPRDKSGKWTDGGGLGKEPKTHDDVRRVAINLRRAVYRASGGNVKDWCIATSEAVKSLYPNAEVHFGYYEGREDQAHTIIKLANRFIDVTADQFGGPKIVIRKNLPDQYADMQMDTGTTGRYVSEAAEKIKKDFIQRMATGEPDRYEKDADGNETTISLVDEDDADDTTGDDHRALAEFYASALNAYLDAGLGISADELDHISDELENGDWVLDYDTESQRWHVVESGEPDRYAAEHAPKGGVTIAGKHYRGGQWIPASEVAKADPETRAKIEGAKTKRQEARRSRGSVDTAKLRESLKPHAHHDLTKDEKTNVGRSFRALLSHHGELVVHRLEELAQDLHEALRMTPEDEEGQRRQFSRRLKAVEHMLDMAKEKGHEGVVPDRIKPESEATHAPTADSPERGPGQSADDRGTPGDGGRRSEPGGADRSIAGGTTSAGAGRIVTAREHLTRPADTGLVPEGVRKHLNETGQQGAAKAIEAMDAHGGFLLADGTGVGKTRQQLAVAKTYADRGKKVLMITKAEVIKPDWNKGTVTGSFRDDSNTMGIGLKLNRGDKTLAPGEVHLTTYDNLGKLKDQVDGDTVIIFDESHSMKNWDSARAKHGYEMGKRAAAVMYATATPADKPLHIAHLFRARIFGNGRWEDTYKELGMVQKTVNIGNGRTIQKWEISPHVGAPEVYRRMAGLFDQLTTDGLMLKREISFKGVDIGFDRVQLPPEVHGIMDQIERDMSQRSDLPPGLRKAATLMHQRRQQEPFKVAHVVDAVQKELAEGRQVVVFCSRVNESTVTGKTMSGLADESQEGEQVSNVTSEGTAKLLAEAMQRAGISDYVELHGGATKTPKQKAAAMDKFQGGQAKVIIATVESGGTGINLDDQVGDRPRTLFMMTAPFSAVENVQAAGRVWRLNTKSSPRVRYLFGDTDVDHWNANLIAGKMKALGATVSGEVRALDIPADLSAEGETDYHDETKGAQAQPDAYKWSRSLLRQPGPGGAGGDGNQRGERVAVRGNTYAHKDRLKAAGGRWDPEKGWLVPASAVESLRHPDLQFGDEKSEAAKPAAAEAPKQTPYISEAQRAAVHAGLKHLAANDPDRARERNNVGFNSFDGDFGAKLAAADRLTDSQAAAGAKLLGKYRGQLSPDIHATATTFADRPAESPKELPTAKTPEQPKAAEAKKPTQPSIESRRVNTSKGGRNVHSFAPDESLWKLWKSPSRPSYLSVGKNPRTGSWEASVWGENEGDVAKNVQDLVGRGVRHPTVRR